MSKNYDNPPPLHPNTVQIMEKGAPPIRRHLKPKTPLGPKSATVKRAVAEGRKSSSPKTVKKPSPKTVKKPSPKTVNKPPKLRAATAKPPKRKGKK